MHRAHGHGAPPAPAQHDAAAAAILQALEVPTGTVFSFQDVHVVLVGVVNGTLLSPARGRAVDVQVFVLNYRRRCIAIRGITVQRPRVQVELRSMDSYRLADLPLFVESDQMVELRMVLFPRRFVLARAAAPSVSEGP